MSSLVYPVTFACIWKLPERSSDPGKGFDETEKRDGRVKGLLVRVK